jgi:hypothetical protein
VLVLVLVAAPVPGADGDGPYSFRLSGKAFDERCLKLAAGESIRFQFRSSAPVDFNIHTHRGHEVVYPLRRAATRAFRGTFRAEAAEDYCLMWEQAGGSATVEGTLERLPR